MQSDVSTPTQVLQIILLVKATPDHPYSLKDSHDQRASVPASQRASPSPNAQNSSRGKAQRPNNQAPPNSASAPNPTPNPPPAFLNNPPIQIISSRYTDTSTKTKIKRTQHQHQAQHHTPSNMNPKTKTKGTEVRRKGAYAISPTVQPPLPSPVHPSIPTTYVLSRHQSPSLHVPYSTYQIYIYIYYIINHIHTRTVG